MSILKNYQVVLKVLMKNFIRKTTGIRKETSKKNAGLFSDLIYKTDWCNALINKYLLSPLPMMGIFIVNK
jgi:hypothetical protein